MKKNIWSALCCMALLAGCQQAEEIENADELRMSIEASIGKQDVASRYSGTAFENNDIIGLSVNSGAFVEWTYNGTNWTTTSTVNWEDKTTDHTFYAFYPYVTGASKESVPMPNLAGQDGMMTEVLKRDFLYTTKTQSYGTDGTVSLTGNAAFKHVSSLVVITLKNEGELAGATITGISIAGEDILTQSSYSFETTEVVLSKENAEQANSLNVSLSYTMPNDATGVTYNFILNAGTDELSNMDLIINYKDKENNNRRALLDGLNNGDNNSFVSGKKYSYTLKIVGGKLIVTGNAVVNWGEGFTMDDIVINGSEVNGSSDGDE